VAGRVPWTDPEPMTNVLLDDGRVAAIGAAAGLAATVPMSALMVGGREAGLMSELPPHEIADRTVDRTAGPETGDHEERRALGWVTHFAFGAASGAVYAILRRHLRTPGGPIFHGAAFALGVWAVSYLGWVPALRFMPPADEDERARQPVMIVAHLVFGAILGWLVEPRLDRRRSTLDAVAAKVREAI
jgi:hypothetical protein